MMIDELRLRAEAVGERYDRAMMMEARRRTREAIRDIASRIVPGMAEEDALALTKRCCGKPDSVGAGTVFTCASVSTR